MVLALGKMSYGAHIALYPILGGGAYTFISSWLRSSARQAEKDLWDTMPVAKAVDPDNFNPFSAIPFHNNVEMRYRYADFQMHNYLDARTQTNLRDYIYKGFHNSYDHGNKRQHTYNWVSTVPSHHA